MILSNRRIATALLLLLISVFCAVVSSAQNLPVVSIQTRDTGDIVTKEWRKSCSVTIESSTGHAHSAMTADVRARGNSTFRHPKKPYALRFSKPVSLCGMQAAKKWLLIANFMDHSLLRNSLALAIARTTSLPFTTDDRQVQVVVNGEWKGVYMLCGGVDVAKGRVDLHGGKDVLVEMDSYDADSTAIRTPFRGLPAHVRFPVDIPEVDRKYVAKLLRATEDAIYLDKSQRKQAGIADDEWQKWIDMDSYADYWIVQELMMNAEPNGPRSCYMIFDVALGRWKAGPVWDYDLSLNPVGLDAGGDIRPYRFHRKDVVELTTDSSFCSGALWYDALLQKPAFRHHVQCRWATLRGKLYALLGGIDDMAAAMQTQAERDQALWLERDPAKFDTSTSWREAVDNVKSNYEKRLKWMDAYVANIAGAKSGVACCKPNTTTECSHEHNAKH